MGFLGHTLGEGALFSPLRRHVVEDLGGRVSFGIIEVVVPSSQRQIGPSIERRRKIESDQRISCGSEEGLTLTARRGVCWCALNEEYEEEDERADRKALLGAILPNISRWWRGGGMNKGVMRQQGEQRNASQAEKSTREQSWSAVVGGCSHC